MLRATCYLLFALSFLFWTCRPSQNESQDTRPNILFIAIDDLRP